MVLQLHDGDRGRCHNAHSPGGGIDELRHLGCGIGGGYGKVREFQLQNAYAVGRWGGCPHRM